MSLTNLLRCVRVAGYLTLSGWVLFLAAVVWSRIPPKAARKRRA